MSEAKKEITTEEAVKAIQKAEEEKLSTLQKKMQVLMEEAGYTLSVEHSIVFKKVK